MKHLCKRMQQTAPHHHHHPPAAARRCPAANPRATPTRVLPRRYAAMQLPHAPPAHGHASPDTYHQTHVPTRTTTTNPQPTTTTTNLTAAARPCPYALVPGDTCYTPKPAPPPTTHQQLHVRARRCALPALPPWPASSPRRRLADARLAHQLLPHVLDLVCRPGKRKPTCVVVNLRWIPNGVLNGGARCKQTETRGVGCSVERERSMGVGPAAPVAAPLLPTSVHHTHLPYSSPRGTPPSRDTPLSPRPPPPPVRPLPPCRPLTLVPRLAAATATRPRCRPGRQ